ncbi:MAG TPA: hypothetical protein PLL92_00245 [Alicycliphilus sp.]|nr:hypothetical protein [Alicycliphilus sp.]
MLQELIVALIIIAAVAYMAWRYLPAALRQRLGRLHPSLAAGPGGCGSGGGGCSSCGGCAAAKGAAQEHPPSSAAPSHVGR